MIFDRKLSEKNIQQLCGVMTKTLADALQDYRQEVVRERSKRTCELSGLMDKNHKAILKLSDTVEDFLDTLQEKDENATDLHAQQRQNCPKEQEDKLLKLLLLYREQMELSEQWFMVGHDNDEAAMAWRQQYAMLNGKIRTESKLCAIEDIGMTGETVDYRFHEVLQAIEPECDEQAGTVAKVCSHGMIYQGTVIQKARVVAYRARKDED